MYSTGDIPSDFEKNIIIPIPKKKRAEKCEDFRIISLTTHASKILTRIIYRRTERRAEEFLGPIRVQKKQGHKGSNFGP